MTVEALTGRPIAVAQRDGFVSGGIFRLGSDKHDPDAAVRRVIVDPFLIDRKGGAHPCAPNDDRRRRPAGAMRMRGVTPRSTSDFRGGLAKGEMHEP